VPANVEAHARSSTNAPDARTARAMADVLLQLLLQLSANPPLAAFFNTSVPPAAPCLPLIYELLLSTASLALTSCTPASLAPDYMPCPLGPFSGQKFVIASIVACADTDNALHHSMHVSSATGACDDHGACPALPLLDNVSCEALVCACDGEDDDECIDCPPSRAVSFPCNTAPIFVPHRAACLRLFSHIPPSSLRSPFAASLAHHRTLPSDRIIFKISSSACILPEVHVETTPALGPWVLGRLDRWHVAQASDDDYYAALDLTYTRVTLGDKCPDALCLDGSKGVYYMYCRHMSHSMPVNALHAWLSCAPRMHCDFPRIFLLQTNSFPALTPSSCCHLASAPPATNGASLSRAVAGARATTTAWHAARCKALPCLLSRFHAQLTNNVSSPSLIAQSLINPSPCRDHWGQAKGCPSTASAHRAQCGECTGLHYTMKVVDIY